MSCKNSLLEPQFSRLFLSFATVIACLLSSALAQTPTFTYQGRLTDNSAAASGTYEMQFSLFDSVGGPTQIGSTITNSAVTVTNGIFTVNLDFSLATPFSTGADRFLQIAVRKATDPPGFTLLTPRQQITSSPYSIRTLSANSSDTLSTLCVGCVDDAKISDVAGAKVTGTVASATNAANVTGVVPIANGGTGSSTKNFVDLTTSQTIGGTKTFNGLVNFGSLPPSGLLGQPLATAFGTATVNPGAAFVLIPGLSATINVPAICASGSTACTVYISADGGVQTTSAAINGVSRVDIALVIDGVIVPAGGYRRIIAANTDGSTTHIENWALGGSTSSLSVGSHTIQIHTALQSGSAANVGGNSTSVLQGRLTVFLLRQ